jgi:hypothetical protein
MGRNLGSQFSIARMNLWQEVVENSELVSKCEQGTRKVGPDKTGSASNENIHKMRLCLSVRILYKSEDLQSLSYAHRSLNFLPKVTPILSIKSTSESSRSIKDENDRHNNTGEPNRC